MITTRRVVAALVLLLGAVVSGLLLAEHRGHTLAAPRASSTTA